MDYGYDESQRVYGQFGQYTYPAINRPAPHIGHMNHLCDLADKGQITLDQMKELVKDPKFICKKCGRVANKEENLCEPVPL
jgi:hypothetical protein